MEKLKDHLEYLWDTLRLHLKEYFLIDVFVLVAIIWLIVLGIALGYNVKDSKAEYLQLCANTGKTQSYCEMRYFEISRCNSYE